MQTRVLLLLASVAPLALAAARRPVDPGWRTDYAAACIEAEQAGKPLMVVFR